MEETKKDIQQFLIEHETEDWIKRNKDIMKDAAELCHLAVMFKMKWGMPIKMVFDEEYKEPQGRQLGEGML